MCAVEGCKNRGRHKFFGHGICGSHKKRILGPLEMYAASWIKAMEDADIINEGLEKKSSQKEESARK